MPLIGVVWTYWISWVLLVESIIATIALAVGWLLMIVIPQHEARRRQGQRTSLPPGNSAASLSANDRGP
jgi:hypothetical protein